MPVRLDRHYQSEDTLCCPMLRTAQRGFSPSCNDHSAPAVLRCIGGGFNEITLDMSWSRTVTPTVIQRKSNCIYIVLS